MRCGQADVRAIGAVARRGYLALLSGIGPLNLATLLTEELNGVRDRDYQALRCQGGVAPVTKQSGKSRYVVQRWACNKRLAHALLHWARVAVQHDPASRAKYRALRARGKSWGWLPPGVADATFTWRAPSA